MTLTIYNGMSDIVVFWHKLNSTAEKTRDGVTTDQQIGNKKCGNYYRQKIISKTVTVLYIITETVRFNYIRSSRRQVPREIQP